MMTSDIGETQVEEEVIASPCNRVCTLDDDDVCLGCFRTVEEIKAWRGSDRAGRLAILANAAQRQASKEDTRHWWDVRPRG